MAWPISRESFFFRRFTRVKYVVKYEKKTSTLAFFFYLNMFAFVYSPHREFRENVWAAHFGWALASA